MKKLIAQYDENEGGWLATLKLTGDIFLRVALSKSGYVVVKQRDRFGVFRVLQTTISMTEFESKIYGKTKGKVIQILSSVEPTEISYANI